MLASLCISDEKFGVWSSRAVKQNRLLVYKLQEIFFNYVIITK